MVAVFNYPLCDERDIVPVLEESSQWPDNPLIIFTPYIVGDALRYACLIKTVFLMSHLSLLS